MFICVYVSGIVWASCGPQVLWTDGTVREKLHLILKATTTHAARLALYAFLYKTVFNGAKLE